MPVPPILRLNDVVFLDWRSDPLESFSNYKIVVTHDIDGGAIMTEYNVHKAVLARGCTYFETLLRPFRAGFAESQSSMSRIHLNARLANTFPFFLDCLYGQ